jgi:hypothetical protein
MSETISGTTRETATDKGEQILTDDERQDLIDRLERDDEGDPELQAAMDTGAEAGERWAREEARRRQLARVAEFYRDRGKRPAPDWSVIAGVIAGRNLANDEVADRWSDIAGDAWQEYRGDEELGRLFVEAFVERAAAIYDEVAE